ncbi:MAG TPA: hypothetical protein VNF99_15835 [Stellaceae bacterium]|nr:hypothetical protein [Stellaceae bacterium]
MARRTLWSALMLAWLSGTNASLVIDDPGTPSFSVENQSTGGATAMPGDVNSPDEATEAIAPKLSR